MLVLSRHKHESIIATMPDGGEIRICVVEIRGDKVRLGVEAPKNVPVNREEVHKAKQRSAAGVEDAARAGM